jgi:hypothetical protein
MRKVLKIKYLLGSVALACFVALAGSFGAAQEDKPVREVYQAQALGQGTQFGKTFEVTINIDQYSPPEDRQVLVDAFKQKGSEGLYNAVEKMHSRGRIAITGTLGYDVGYARKIKTDDGFKIRLLTNRPLRFGEVWASGRSLDYNLSYLELNVNDTMSKSTGTLLPACKFMVDKKTGEVVVEAFLNPWKLQNIMDRSKN